MKMQIFFICEVRYIFRGIEEFHAEILRLF
jgi:hypothetical protein